MNAVDMTQESMWKVIVKFSIPLMLGNICQQLYLFIDALIVGRRLGVNGLAAFRIYRMVRLFGIWIYTGYNTGVFSVYIAKFKDEAKRTFTAVHL